MKCVTVTKNNRYIISGSYDATIRVFSFETLALLQTFDVSKPNNVQGYHAESNLLYGQKVIFKKIDKNFVLCLASTRDCRYVIAGLKDKSLRIFDLEKIESPFIFEASHESNL